jgi:hypothetical protein
MTGVAGGPNGFVAIGARTVQLQPVRADNIRIDNLSWFSSDGRHWQTGTAKAFEVKRSTVQLSGIASGPSGYVIAGSIAQTGAAQGSDRPAFWASTDGRVWTRTSPDSGSDPGAAPFGVVAGGPGYVAVGGCLDATCAISWTSADGLTWTRHTIDTSESPPVPQSGEAAGPRTSDGPSAIG